MNSRKAATFLTLALTLTVLFAARDARAALAAPTGLSVSAGIDTLTISWNAVSGAASYKVYPTADCSGMGKPSLVNSYSYATKKDATYQFTVRAVDSAKVLGACSSATSSMSSSQLAAPTGLSVTRAVNAFTITWSARANASYYQLFTADGTCGGKPKKVTGTSYTMTGKLATTYNFAIRALTAKGRSGICSSATGARYVLPAAPTVSGVTIGTDGSTRTVSWSKVKNVTFTVQRSTTASNSGFSNLGTGLTSTSYTETSACPVATCYYKVVASAHGDNSADSNVVTSTGVPSGVGGTLTPVLRCTPRDFVGVWGSYSPDGGNDGEIRYTVPTGKTLKKVFIYDYDQPNNYLWSSYYYHNAGLNETAYPVGVVLANNSLDRTSDGDLSIPAGTTVTFAFGLKTHLASYIYASGTPAQRSFVVDLGFTDNTQSEGVVQFGNTCQ